MTKPLKKSDALAVKDILEKVMQIRVQVLELFQNMDSVQRISDMPDSLVPTDMLLDILVTYEAMYEQLIENQLIKSGNPHKTNPNLH